MSTIIEEKVDALKGIIDATEVMELNRMGEYRLSDAIREGSQVADQAYTWMEGENLCALSAAVVARRARGL